MLKLNKGNVYMLLHNGYLADPVMTYELEYDRRHDYDP